MNIQNKILSFIVVGALLSCAAYGSGEEKEGEGIYRQSLSEIRADLLASSGPVNNSNLDVDQKIFDLWKKEVDNIHSHRIEKDQELGKGFLPRCILEEKLKDKSEVKIQILSEMILLGKNKSLMDWIFERSIHEDFSEGDLVVCMAVGEAIKNANPYNRKKYFDDWTPLASAKNPVYRFLFLRVSRYVFSAKALDTYGMEDARFLEFDLKHKIRFFMPFFKSRDPVILEELMPAISAPVLFPEVKQELMSLQKELKGEKYKKVQKMMDEVLKKGLSPDPAKSAPQSPKP